MRDAGTLPGDIRSFIFDLNGAKQAPGFSVSDNRGVQRPTQTGLWQFDIDGSVQSITPLEPLASAQTSVALGINEVGEVVGRSATADGQNVTVYWGAGQTSPELLPVLSENPGSYVRAWQINDSSLVVVNYATPPTQSGLQPFGRGIPAVGSMLTCKRSFLPTVVGISLVRCPSITRVRLSATAPSTGEQRGFLLTPVSVPEPGLLFGMGAIALLAAHLRRKSGAIDSI